MLSLLNCKWAMKFYFLRMKSDEVGTTLKHPITINGNVKNLSKSDISRRYWPRACLQSHWKWSKIIIFKSVADRLKFGSNRSDLLRNRPIHVNWTEFGTKPAGSWPVWYQTGRPIRSVYRFGPVTYWIGQTGRFQSGSVRFLKLWLWPANFKRSLAKGSTRVL